MTEAKRIPAIPTEYQGIRFRSKLEAKYAKAFDLLGIPWVYEEINFEFDDGTRYAPDFYFPDSKQFFEVKGLMTPEDKHKIVQLARAGNTVIVGGPNGKLLYLNGTPDGLFNPDTLSDDAYQWIGNRFSTREDWFGGYPLDHVFVAECVKCHKRSFMDSTDNYKCPCCGAYDGDHYIQSVTWECDDLFSEVFSE